MTDTKRKKPVDYNTMIIMASMMVLVVRYVGAFIASDAVSMPDWLSYILTAGIGISGLGMGLLDGLGGAVIFQGWRTQMPRLDQRWPFKFITLTIFVFLIIINGVIVMLPYTVMRTAGVNMISVLGNENSGFLWAWGIAVNIAPYLIIGGAMSSSSVNFDNERTKSLSTNNQNPLNNEKITGDNGEKTPEKKEEHWDWRQHSIAFDETTLIVIAKLTTKQLQTTYPGMSEQVARWWRRRSLEKLVSDYKYTLEMFKEKGIKVKNTDRIGGSG